MARRRELNLVCWDGESWSRSRVRSAAGSWEIDASDTAPGEADQFPESLRSGRRSKRREPLVFLDAGLPLMVKEVAVPLVAPEKQAATLAGEVGRAVPFALEEVAWDALVLDEDAIERRMLLLAAREAKWARRRSAVADVAAEVSCETLPVALLNLWPFLRRPGDALTAVLFPLAENAVLLFGEGDRVSARITQSGLGDGGPAALARLQGECARALAAYRRQQSATGPAVLRLLGSSAEALAARLNIPGDVTVEAVIEAEAIGALPITGLERIAASHRLLVAGAILGSDEVSALRSDLLPHAERMRQSQPSSGPWLWATAAALLVAGGLWWWPAWNAHQVLQRELDSIRTRSAAVEPFARQLSELEAAIAREERARAGVIDLGSSRANWSNFLVDLQDRLGAIENVWIDGLDVVREASPEAEPVVDEFAPELPETEPAPVARYQLRLRGRLLDPDNPLKMVSREMRSRVNDLIDSLAGSAYVEAVTDPRFDPREGLLQFTFTLTINPERRL